MAPRVTSSRNRSRGRANQPVTTSRGRRNRQNASNTRVSQGSNGRPQYPSPNNASNRVTNDRQRPPGGNARVTRGAGARPELPPAGGSTGNTSRAQNQAAWARDRGARAQLGRTLNTLAQGAARGLGLDPLSQAQNRLNRAAQGTRGEGVRVVGPGGANPKGRPQLPPGRTAGSLPPGRPGGALVNRPGNGGSLGTRPVNGPLANRGSSALANRPNSAPVDGRLVGVNVAEIRRRPRIEGQRALPPGQQVLPPGRSGGGGSRPSLPPGRPGGALANRPSGGSPNRPALPPGRPGGALANRPSGGGGGSSRPALPPGRQNGAAAGSGAAARPAAAGSGLTGRIIRGGGALGIAGPLLTPVVQGIGRAAGQWVGRNVLLPMVDQYESSRPGIQSDRERRRTIASQGGRQGPPVPERVRRGRPQQQQAPSRGGGSVPAAEPTPSYSRPQAPASTNRPSGGSQSRPQASSGTSTPASSQRPAAAAPSSQSGGSEGASWKEKFNSGRGTSYTNNPLLRNDAYLMGKMKEREAKLPTGPVSDGEQYGESLRIRRLKQEDEARKKKK